MMKVHTKNYFKYFGIAFDPVSGWHDHIPCENCKKTKTVDLHHIEIKGMGGQKKKQKELDRAENIIALCRKCHEMAHSGDLTKGDLDYIHCTYIMNLGRK